MWRMGGAGVAHTAASATLAHKRCVRAVRQTAMTADGRMVIAACDEGTVWRWDLVDVGVGGAGSGVGEKRARPGKDDDETDENVDEGVDGGDVAGATGETIEILD